MRTKNSRNQAGKRYNKFAKETPSEIGFHEKEANNQKLFVQQMMRPHSSAKTLLKKKLEKKPEKKIRYSSPHGRGHGKNIKSKANTSNPNTNQFNRSKPDTSNPNTNQFNTSKSNTNQFNTSKPNTNKTLTVQQVIEKHSNKLDETNPAIIIAMAAGTGRRIKSSFPKVMHKLWGVPSVLRVLEAASAAFSTPNQVIVVGKKAKEVVLALGEKKHREYAFQELQKGTGHAVQVALQVIPQDYKGIVCIIPGDMGLISEEALHDFYKAYKESSCQLMMFSGKFKGHADENYFGRVLRIPGQNETGDTEHVPRVASILQHKDLLGYKEENKKNIDIFFRNKKHTFSVESILNLEEFDSGVFIFSVPDLREHISEIKSQNIQQEIYLTDLVDIFNRQNLHVGSFSIENSDLLLGFNDKNMWRRMQDVFRQRCYKELSNLVDFEDQHRFYVHEKIMKKIIEQDEKFSPLDIHLGSGAWIDENVSFHRAVYFGDNVHVSGNITIGKHVRFEKNVYLSTLDNQKIVIEDNVTLQGSNIIRGNVFIEEGTVIDSHVNITGSDKFPTRIGKKSYIQGTSYIFGCTIAPESIIVTSILYKKRISARRSKDGRIQAVRYVLPTPEGLSSISEL